MRQIPVTTDVYAAIWAARRPSEENEDQILRRVLGVDPAVVHEPQTPSNPAANVGYRDPRFGVEFPEGFEIFRTFKGTEYRAQATGGRWRLLNTGVLYPSINQLSRAIGTRVENAWNNWYYVAPDGERHLITHLRRFSA